MDSQPHRDPPSGGQEARSPFNLKDIPTTHGPPGHYPTSPAKAKEWNRQWIDFFHLYHRAMITCTKSALAKRGLTQVDPDKVDKIVIDVMRNLYDSKSPPVNLERYRLRQTLRHLINCRVVDFIRHNNREDKKLGQPVMHEGSVDLSKLPTEEADPEADHQLQALFWMALMDYLKKNIRSPRVYLIFQMVKYEQRSPDEVAAEFRVSRGVIDNTVSKAMKKLHELVRKPNFADLLQNSDDPDAAGRKLDSSLAPPSLADILNDDKLIEFLQASYKVNASFSLSDEHRKVETQLETIRKTKLLQTGLS